MRNTIIMIVALIAAVVAAIYFNQGGSGSRLAEGETPSADTAIPSEEPVMEARRNPGTLDPTPDVDPDEAAPAATDEAPIDPSRWRQLRVVDQVTKKPVPGAEVFFMSQAGIMANSAMVRQLMGQGVGAYETLLVSRGQASRCDEKGEVLIPRTSDPAWVHARGPGGIAYRMVRERATDPIILELEEPDIGQIQTVDARGNPVADVPVAIVVGPPNGKFRIPYWRGVTRGSEALVEARNPDLFRRHSDPSDAEHPHVLEAVLDFPLAGSDRPTSRPSTGNGSDSPTCVKLVDDRFPEGPIRLQVPDTGRIVVEIVEPHDRTLEVSLVAGSSQEAMMSAGRLQASTKGGPVVFERVGLGLELNLELTDPEAAFEPKSMVVKGPTAVGEEVLVTIGLDAERSVLEGRVVDAAGEPIRNQPLVLVSSPFSNDLPQRRAGSGTRRVPLKSDEQGRFRMPLDDLGATWTGTGPLMLAIASSESGKATNSILEGELIISGPFAPGVTTLKDIEMIETPVVVRGRVVDDRGEPIPLAKVSMSPKDEEVRARERNIGRANLGRRGVTDAEGRFALRAPWADMEVEVRAQHDDYLSPPRKSATNPIVRVGDQDLEFVLTRPGGIKGSLLLDPGVPRPLISVSGRSGSRVRPDEGGDFEIQRILPGLQELQIRTRGSFRRGGGEVLHEVKGIEISAGAMSSDPRLQGIDLRGRIAAPVPPPTAPTAEYRIKVLDEEGRPLSQVRVIEGTVDFRGGGIVLTSEDSLQGISKKDGTLVLAGPGPAMEVCASKSGFADAQFRIKPGENEIVLTRKYSVQVDLKFGGPVPGGGLNVVLDGVYATANDVHESERSWSGRFHPEKPGRHELRVSFAFYKPGAPSESGGQAWDCTHVQLEKARFVEVLPGEYSKTVRFEIDKKELAAVKEKGR